MNELRLWLGSAAATERLGARLAAALPARAIVFLYGDLGAGKTTLVRGLLQALGHQGAVRSPTYTLLEPYQLPGRACYHLDLYRLADPEELEYLGLREMLAEDCLCFIEWPQRGAGWLPPADLELELEYRGDGRQAWLRANTPAAAAVLTALHAGEQGS